MKKTIAFLFFYLNLLHLSAEMSVLSFRKVENDMAARIDAKKTDQNGDVCAIIKVETTQTGFSWEPDGLGIVHVSPQAGEYWLYVPYGAKRLTIKHPQLGILRDYLYPLSIEKATVYVLTLTTGKVITTVEETIESQWLVINPEPADAAIYMDEVFVKTGAYTANKKAGFYVYRVEAPLYHTEAGKVEITDSKKELNIKLKPAFGYISISTTPEKDAKVIIDGKALTNTTPCKSEALASGEHTVQILKEMYQPTTKKLVVRDGEITPSNFVMQPNFAEITLAAPKEASLYINNQQKGTGTWSGRLNAGVYSLEARLDKYRTAKQDIEVVAGDIKKVDLQPAPIFGSLDILSTPLGANISINGKEYGTTPNTINKLLIGDYAVKITKSGYNNTTRVVNIKDGKQTTVNETLSIGRSINITSMPSGVPLYIDGKLVGQTPLSSILSYGDHVLRIVNDEIKADKIINVSQADEEGSFNLLFNSKMVNITSSPSNADVYIDAKYIGKSPLKTELSFTKHSLELSLGDKLSKQELDFDNGSSTELHSKLLECNDSKLIESNPSGVSVYMNKVYMGATPVKIIITKKKEAIELKQEGYFTYRETLECGSKSSNYVQLKEKESHKWHPDKLYFSGSYGNNCPFQLTMGSLNNKEIGSYLNIGLNSDLFTFGTYFTIDNNGNHPESVFSDIRYAGEIRRGRAKAVYGKTYKLFHPLWLTIGGGIAYNSVFLKMDQYFDSGDYESTTWVKNSDLSKWDGVFESGLIADLGGFLVNGSLITNDFTNWNLSLGIGFTFNK